MRLPPLAIRSPPMSAAAKSAEYQSIRLNVAGADNNAVVLLLIAATSSQHESGGDVLDQFEPAL